MSIVIPHYNRSRLLAETIRSVNNQTYKDWEIIIVDDGSSEEEINTLQLFNAPNIHIHYRNILPKGASQCRNIGLTHAKGTYVLFLDSDDLLATWCLETRIKAFSSYPDNDFCVFPVLNFIEKPGDINQLWNSIDTSIDPLEQFLTFDGPWCVSSSFWKKETLVSLGGFNTELNYGDDAELHIRALLKQLKYKEFPLFIPDCFIRRGNELRYTNQISELEVNSKINYLNKVFELLSTQTTNKKLVYCLSIGYFIEAEWCIYKSFFYQANLIKNKLISNQKNKPFENAFINAYFKYSFVLIQKNYLAFRLYRRIFSIVLPKYLKKRRATAINIDDKTQLFIQYNWQGYKISVNQIF